MLHQPVDIRTVRNDANALLHTAQVSPTRFVLLYVVIVFALQMLDTAVSHLAEGSLGFAYLSVSFFSMLVSLFVNVLSAGVVCYALRVCRGESAGYDYLFDGFSFAGKLVALTLLEGLLIGLGTFCLVIPGLILAYTYSLSVSNLCDDPSLGVIAAMRASRQQMDGHKIELLRLHLTFWPQLLLFVIVIAAAALLSPTVPSTLAGDLLFTAALLLCSGAITLCFFPCLSLAATRFYLLVSAPSGALNEESETPEA